MIFIRPFHHSGFTVLQILVPEMAAFGFAFVAGLSRGTVCRSG
ncbi:hypothetical protein IMCC14465_07050 [alpha proteobacterium IMCC14465]|uniref:Uncharacterized protein n=1 Tax=alpha proteobacterium IMCC14465 TaxID=1220535 RepID=J9DYZ9_9PROT|nr:hypothetical protein IMCC14465_07050 [alpha proteobacterium IMCC14465]